jgi:hypothetical protein
MQKREPVRARDQDGREIVIVPLARGRGEAIVDGEDFDALAAVGLTSSWYLNGVAGHQYVRASLGDTPGNNISLARVITGAGPRQIVRYGDRNRRNLRRRNLVVQRGPSKRTDASLVLAAHAAAAHVQQGTPEQLVEAS